ncbi:MAG: hypothetical protein A4E44_01083 [Methanosaeta sp. PtaB.Bin018]|nr:MAG: hypothetical protein A4E44_01083 [Methanosaeta sp. PtaB.Bin018]OPY44002.1 MAG: hypothetical protein A4E46_01571 [Methanosaeta sp. PtaU1.Bin016]
MDRVVHINDGSVETGPIVLRLLPGEETIINLKVVNHGEPTNVSLVASDPVIKAVRLRRPDHYVVLEETIPIMARMPLDLDRLDGEILLTSNEGKSRVPITLLRDSEDPGDDLEGPEVQMEEDLDDLEAAEARDLEERDVEDLDDDLEDDEANEPRRIVFSKDSDLQRYRSATRPNDLEENTNVELSCGESSQNSPRDGFVQGRRRFRERPAYSSVQEEGRSAMNESEDDSTDDPDSGGSFVNPGKLGALKVIPMIIFSSLVIVLGLTFITESIPEFPGAMASSILIVTLIIYGAATLLKA